MREILFRGKRIDNGKWIEGLPIYAYSSGEWSITHSSGWTPTYNNPDEGEYTEYTPINPETIFQYSGHNTIKGNKIFENTIVFSEEENEDGTDNRIYLICKWIKEWSMFALLTYEELIKYEDLGIDSLDEEMFWKYNLENSELYYHYAGEYFDNPKLIEQ